ncbi:MULTISPECIES: hypothetical protein [unclassified Rhizobium]|uniref:hypothetical protein n=1 Tax=unclassified Rhizobium TaxID=2613769 RepID=UPI0011AB50D8|nr:MULTISPECIES: hypothetical protein [unclassified Rhizobium]
MAPTLLRHRELLLLSFATRFATTGLLFRTMDADAWFELRCAEVPDHRAVDDDVLGWCCPPYGLDDILRERGWQGAPPDFMATCSNGLIST